VVNKQKHQFDVVFDCRGSGGKSHFADLRGVRGEILWMHAPEVHIQRPIRFLHPRYSLYIVPRSNQVYLIGASEIDAEDYSPISVKTTLELLTAVYYVHPGFAEARILQADTHCRPTLSDHLPQIRYTEGLIAINGLYRHGYLIAPTLVEDVLLYFNDGLNAVNYRNLWKETE
jgi:glycine oxidase